MSLPIQRPSGGTPTSADFVSLQTLWARILGPIIDTFNAGDGVPVGTVWIWPVGAAPKKFLLCNGDVLPQAQNMALFAVIGTSQNTGGEPAGWFVSIQVKCEGL